MHHLPPPDLRVREPFIPQHGIAAAGFVVRGRERGRHGPPDDVFGFEEVVVDEDGDGGAPEEADEGEVALSP